MLINGNCEIELKKIESESVDAVITDPPYQYLKHKLDIPFDYELVFDELYRIMKPNSFLIYFGRGIPFYEWNIYNSKRLKFKEELIWEKKSSSPILNPQRTHENIVIFQKGNKKLNRVYLNKIVNDYLADQSYRQNQNINRILSSIKKINNYDDFVKWQTEVKKKASKQNITTGALNGKDIGYRTYKSYKKGMLLRTIIRVTRENYTYQHPTQKPVRLMQILVSLATAKGETVLDPFMGGGSTGVACRKLNRKFIGIEIDKEYYKIAKNRINKIQKGMF